MRTLQDDLADREAAWENDDHWPLTVYEPPSRRRGRIRLVLAGLLMVGLLAGVWVALP